MATLQDVLVTHSTRFNLAKIPRGRTINGPVQYHLTGPNATDLIGTVADGNYSVTAGVHPSPVLTVTMTTEDYVAMHTGTTSVAKLWASGRMLTRGDKMTANALGKAFKPPRPPKK